MGNYAFKILKAPIALIALSCFFFVIGCVPKVKTTVRMDCWINPEEASDLLSESWLIIPFVPQNGMGRDLEDIGGFADYIKNARPRQKMLLYGRNVERLTRDQAKAHLGYVHYIQKNRDVPDSLLSSMVGDYPQKILITPYLKSNVIQKKDQIFARRMVIEVKFWQKPYNSPFMTLQAIVLDESINEKKLLLPEQIFKAGLKAIADKILYNPLSNTSSTSEPDY